ncbi:hypothetical protein [Halioglobus sp. HI00S01]|uniref:hypothetical protein n=1 Tax=Halioglobus sp. HI00S01 TaxID=1822214 RepID=UPI000826510C|nr:hypothetical protein [Halioglobus sp. HI00S01]
MDEQDIDTDIKEKSAERSVSAHVGESADLFAEVDTPIEADELRAMILSDDFSSSDVAAVLDRVTDSVAVLECLQSDDIDIAAAAAKHPLVGNDPALVSLALGRDHASITDALLKNPLLGGDVLSKVLETQNLPNEQRDLVGSKIAELKGDDFELDTSSFGDDALMNAEIPDFQMGETQDEFANTEPPTANVVDINDHRTSEPNLAADVQDGVNASSVAANDQWDPLGPTLENDITSEDKAFIGPAYDDVPPYEQHEPLPQWEEERGLDDSAILSDEEHPNAPEQDMFPDVEEEEASSLEDLENQLPQSDPPDAAKPPRETQPEQQQLTGGAAFVETIADGIRALGSGLARIYRTVTSKEVHEFDGAMRDRMIARIEADMTACSDKRLDDALNTINDMHSSEVMINAPDKAVGMLERSLAASVDNMKRSNEFVGLKSRLDDLSQDFGHLSDTQAKIDEMIGRWGAGMDEKMGRIIDTSGIKGDAAEEVKNSLLQWTERFKTGFGNIISGFFSRKTKDMAPG